MSEKEKESGKGIVGEGYDDLDGQTGNGNCTASSRDKGNVKRDASTVFASASTSASSSTPTPSSSKLSSKPKNTKSQPKSNTPSPSTSASHTLTALALTFLGTASAQPSSTRAHSSLALTLEGRKGGEVWLFDCGEGTQGRIMQSGGGEGKVKVKMGKVGKVFLTHLHGDHVFGLAPFLATAMNGAGGIVEDPEKGIFDERVVREGSTADSEFPTIEIYGPLHTRAYIRSALTYTYTHLSGRYVVHELRLAHEPLTDTCSLLLHPSELPSGRNIPQSPTDGTWRGVFEDATIRVDAAPITHSVPCVGYVVTTADVPRKVDAGTLVPLVKRSGAPMSVLGRVQRGEDVVLPDGTLLKGVGTRPGKKVVVLGDTCDAVGECEAMVAMARGADLLVHEATNAYLPDVPQSLGGEMGTTSKSSETASSVRERAVSRGHSTPELAGAFAKRIEARMLVLNHFSARYSGGDGEGERGVMEKIRRLAVESFGSEKVVCARDLESVVVGMGRG